MVIMGLSKSPDSIFVETKSIIGIKAIIVKPQIRKKIPANAGTETKLNTGISVKPSLRS